MDSLLRDFNLWLNKTSSETGIPLEVLILVVSAASVALVALILLALRRLLGRERTASAEEPEERGTGVASGTLSELLEEE